MNESTLKVKAVLTCRYFFAERKNDSYCTRPNLLQTYVKVEGLYDPVESIELIPI